MTIRTVSAEVSFRYRWRDGLSATASRYAGVRVPIQIQPGFPSARTKAEGKSPPASPISGPSTRSVSLPRKTFKLSPAPHQREANGSGGENRRIVQREVDASVHQHGDGTQKYENKTEMLQRSRAHQTDNS
jgi:hypothetical protein